MNWAGAGNGGPQAAQRQQQGRAAGRACKLYAARGSKLLCLLTCMAASWLLPFCFSQASHLALPAHTIMGYAEYGN